MSNFDEKTVDRIKRLEREVERLQVKERPIVITDHGNLTGLGDNDHPQYLLTTAKAADSDKLDGKDSTDFVDKTTFDSGWTSYTPTFDGWTGTVYNVCKYKTIGKTCIVRINITSGTSDSTDGNISTATLPFTSRNVANLTWDGACGKCADNGTILTTPCRWEVLPNSNIVSFYKDMNVGAWTKSGTKYQKAIIIYEIA